MARTRGRLPSTVARKQTGFFAAKSRISFLVIIGLPGLRRLSDFFFAVHIWPEDFGDCYRAVGVLVKLHERDQNSRRGDNGIIKRVTENVLLRGGIFIAEIHSPGLEFVELAGAVGFAIIAARGHPCFDIEFLSLASSEVARADVDDTVGQLERLHHSLGV